MSVETAQILELPYTEDFEVSVIERDKHEWNTGTTADFNNSTYTFPAHSGKYAAVNTSDANSAGWISTCDDILATEPLNLDATPRITIEFEYFADIKVFELLYRKNIYTPWKTLKVLDTTTVWKDFSFIVPDSCKINGAQFGVFFDNDNKVSNGAAIDNISIKTMEGKHIEVQYADAAVANSVDTVCFGNTLPATTDSYSFNIINIGSEDVAISSIDLTGTDFAAVAVNTTLTPGDTLAYEVTFAPQTEDSFEGKITVNSDAAINPYDVNFKATCMPAQLTYMFYLTEGEEDIINKLEANGSIRNNINYICLYDATDSTKDGIYMIKKDMDGAGNSTIVSDLINTDLNANLNMKSWETLKDFITWTKENYPAEHYGLNITGEVKTNYTDTICEKMTLSGLDSALMAFKAIDNTPFDVVGLDLSPYGNVEAAYELKDETNYVVFSEVKKENNADWDYENLFSIFHNTVNIENWVAAVVDSCKNINTGATNAYSAIKTMDFETVLKPAINTFSTSMVLNITANVDKIKAARDSAFISDGDVENIDMGSFIQELTEQNLEGTGVAEAINGLQTAYNNVVLNSKNNNAEGATGMKVWFVDNFSENLMKEFYSALDFGTATGWIDFLKAVENPVAVGVIITGFDVEADTAVLEVPFAINNTTVANPPANSFTWTITPNTFEFVEGTDANSKHIKVKFNELGAYTVQLEASNGTNTETVTKTNVIFVREPIFKAPTDLTVAYDTVNRNANLAWNFPIVDKLTEDFEGAGFPPVGWTVTHSLTLDGEQSTPTATTWQKNTTYVHSGTTSAGLPYSAPEFNWLITPEIEVTGGDALSFWMRYHNSATFTTTFRVMIFSDGVWTQELFYGEGQADNEFYAPINIGLSKYAGKTIKIAFVGEYTNGWIIAIDDVSICAPGAEDGNFAGYKIYRNDVELTTLATSTETTYTDSLKSAPAGEYTYKVSTLWATPEGESDASNEVTINTAVLNVDFEADETTIYTDQVVNIESDILSNPDVETYTWTITPATYEFVENTNVNSENIKVKFTVAGDYQISLTVNNGMLEKTEVKTDYIKVNAASLTVDFEANDTTPYVEQIVTITKDVTSNPEVESYAWTITPATYEFVEGTNANSENVKVKFTAAGDYEVSLTVNNGALEETETKTNYIKVHETTFLAPHNLTGEYDSGNKVVNLSWESWDSSAEGDGTFAGYKVYRDNQVIATVTDQNTTSYHDTLSSKETVYTYKVSAAWTNPDGESDFSNEVEVSVISIDGVSLTKINLYPNPNNGSFVIDFGKIKDAEWSLVSVSGQVIETHKVQQTIVEVNNIPTGLYYVVVKTDEYSNRVFKVVVK